MNEESCRMVMSEWNFVMVKNWAKAEATKRMRLRLRLRPTRTKKLLNRFRLFMEFLISVLVLSITRILKLMKS